MTTLNSWKNMRQRCNNKKFPKYADYGGRGITYCKRWERFENFLADMGECPKGLELERVDNNGGYNKNNCIWGTRGQQVLNQRPKNKLGINGVQWYERDNCWQAVISVEGIRELIYRGPDFFEACCRRKSKEREVYWKASWATINKRLVQPA